MEDLKIDTQVLSRKDSPDFRVSHVAASALEVLTEACNRSMCTRVKGHAMMSSNDAESFHSWQKFQKIVCREKYECSIRGCRRFSTDFMIDVSPMAFQTITLPKRIPAWVSFAMHTFIVKSWNPLPGLDILHTADLDGWGTRMAPWFDKILRPEFGDGNPARACLEWCAGPGFIGLYLLKRGICDHITLVDNSHKAILFAQHAIKTHGLENRAVAYLRDNLMNMPRSAGPFDLVFGNPPFFPWNTTHIVNSPGRHLMSDPQYATHRRFYRQVGRHMTAQARMYIVEYEPYKMNTTHTFRSMARSGNLSTCGIYHPDDTPSYFYIVESRRGLCW